MSLPQGRPAGPSRRADQSTALVVALDGASTMALEREVGSLRTGTQCDRLLADVPTRRCLSYVSGVNHVRRVITRGRSVWER